MADPDQDYGASTPPDDDPPDLDVEASRHRPGFTVDFDRTAQGRSDTSSSTEGVRVGPVIAAVAGVAAVGAVSSLVRRRRAKAQARSRGRRRSRIAGAGGTAALSALFASLRARSARRGR